jgi:hypothetical protein
MHSLKIKDLPDYMMSYLRRTIAHRPSCEKFYLKHNKLLVIWHTGIWNTHTTNKNFREKFAIIKKLLQKLLYPSISRILRFTNL